MNILCDTYSTEHGYICGRCRAEFLDLKIPPTPETLRAFMASDVAFYQDPRLDYTEQFDLIFIDRSSSDGGGS
jgi:hypothetical protein